MLISSDGTVRINPRRDAGARPWMLALASLRQPVPEHRLEYCKLR